MTDFSMMCQISQAHSMKVKKHSRLFVFVCGGYLLSFQMDIEVPVKGTYGTVYKILLISIVVDHLLLI